MRGQGDHWLVNGQKVWTSYADKADWIFVLVRTDPKAPKHDGISFILIDMSAPGVSTKPIKLISGNSPFCETFFDNVKVPKEHAPGVSAIVGEINRGWDVAKYLLTHERETIAAGAADSLQRAVSARSRRRRSDSKAACSPIRSSAPRSRRLKSTAGPSF